MTTLFRRLWDDDQGAVISSELVLVLGILVFGLIPGLVALRNSVNAALATIGNFLGRVTPSFTYSGYTIVGQGGISTIATVGGLAIDFTSVTQLDAAQTEPNDTDFGPETFPGSGIIDPYYGGPFVVEPAP